MSSIAQDEVRKISERENLVLKGLLKMVLYLVIIKYGVIKKTMENLL